MKLIIVLKNYLIPVNNLLNKSNEKLLAIKKENFENIMTQQIIISQLSKGITYQDTENMDEYERIFIIKKLIEMKKEEIEARKEALKNTGR